MIKFGKVTNELVLLSSYWSYSETEILIPVCTACTVISWLSSQQRSFGSINFCTAWKTSYTEFQIKRLTIYCHTHAAFIWICQSFGFTVVPRMKRSHISALHYIILCLLSVTWHPQGESVSLCQELIPHTNMKPYNLIACLLIFRGSGKHLILGWDQYCLLQQEDLSVNLYWLAFDWGMPKVLLFLPNSVVSGQTVVHLL